MKSSLVRCALVFVALGFALAHGQQFNTNCTDVKVEIVPDPSKLDTVCVVTVNGNVSYQRQYVGYGQTNVGTIPEPEARKLLDKKSAWVTFQACSETANQRRRKERKQAHLDCQSTFQTAQPELADSIRRALPSAWTKP
jgi:hypothetical protein